MNTIQRNKVSDYLKQYEQEYLRQNGKESERGILGIFCTPDNICELIDAIARLYNPKTVIDICCGTGNLLSYFSDLQFVKGIDINPEVISLAQKVLPNIDFVQADTLEYDFNNQTYDLVLGSLPFGIRLPNRKSIEDILIMKGINLLSDNGLAIFIVPEVVLFGNANKYIKLRDYLINNCALDMLISLPTNTFRPYTGVKTSILVIRKNKPNRKIFMPAFDGQTSKLVMDFQNCQGEFYLDTSKIKDRLDGDIRLDRSFYLSLQSIEEKLSNYKTVKLCEIATVIRGEFFHERKPKGRYLIFNGKDRDKIIDEFVDDIKDEQCILRDNDIIVSLISRADRIGDSISIYKKK